MSVIQKEVIIVNKYGLHARPAMKFVETANKYACSIEVSTPSLTVDAKSIMSVMRLAATKGTKLRVSADGDDAGEATEALAALVDSGFDEMDGDV